MPINKLKAKFIKDKMMTSKQKLSVIRPDFGQPANVFIGEKIVGTAIFDGKQYYFKAKRFTPNSRIRRQFTIGDKFKKISLFKHKDRK